MARRLLILFVALVTLSDVVDAQLPRFRFRRKPTGLVILPPDNPASPVGNGVALASDADTSNTTSYTFGTSYSATSGRVVVCFLSNSDDLSPDDGPDEPTSLAQSGGPTYTKGTSVVVSTRRLTLFTALGTGAAASAAVATFPGGDNQTGAALACREYPNASTTLGDIRTANANNVGGTLAGAGTLALTTTLTTRAPKSALITGYAWTSACTVTAGSGFALGTEASYTSPVVRVRIHENMNTATLASSPVVSACANNNIDWMGIAVELKASGGGDLSNPVITDVAPATEPTTVTTATGHSITFGCEDNVACVTPTYSCISGCVSSGSLSGSGPYTISGFQLGCSGGSGTSSIFDITGHDAAGNNSTTIRRTFVCRTADTFPPTGSILVPSGPLVDVTSGSYEISGTFSDETAMHATPVVITCPACASIVAPTINGSTYQGSVTPTCNSTPVDNLVTATFRDAANNTFTREVTLRCTTSGTDTTPPSVAITFVSNCTPSNGANCTGNGSANLLTGTASDAIALDHVELLSTTCAPTATFNASLSSGTWSSVQTYSCPPGTHRITARAVDTSGNVATDDLDITNPTPLAIASPTSCPEAEVGTAYTPCTLSATGGTAPYAWVETTGAMGSGACANFTFVDSGNNGVFDDTGGAPTTAGQCVFRAQVTDNVGTVRFQDFVVDVVPAGQTESAHKYFTDMLATGLAQANFSLRSETQVLAQHKFIGNGTIRIWTYDFPGGSDCFGGTCDDTYATPKDGAKLYLPYPLACQDTTNKRTIVSITGGSPVLVTLKKDTGVDANIYAASITGSNNASFNVGPTNVYSKRKRTISASESGTADGLTEVELFTDAAATVPLNIAGTAGAFGLLNLFECQCQPSDPVFQCSGSDNPGYPIVLTSPIDLRSHSAFITWDMWYDPLYTGLHKAFGFVPTNQTLPANVNTNGTVQLQTASDRDDPGNGSRLNGYPSIGVIGHTTMNNDAIKPPGLTKPIDPMFPTGEGGSGVAYENSVASNFHIHHSLWTRYSAYARFNVAWSDPLFDAWRGSVNLQQYENGFPLGDCAVVGTTVTCTQSVVWTAGKDAFKATKFVITGSGAANLDGTYDGVSNGSVSGGLRQIRFTKSGAVACSPCTGTFDPYFWYFSFWAGDQNRDATRILHGMPLGWDPNVRYLNLYMEFDTSDKRGSSPNPRIAYARNVLFLQDVPLDLSGTCNNSVSPVNPAHPDRGWCLSDAQLNPTWFRRPKP